jgi:hypothetical protein
MVDFLLPCCPNVREAARRFQVEGKLPAGWVDAFCAATMTLPSNMLIGFIGWDDFSTTERAAGKSSNAQCVYAGYWATLTLSDNGSTPKQGTL